MAKRIGRLLGVALLSGMLLAGTVVAGPLASEDTLGPAILSSSAAFGAPGGFPIVITPPISATVDYAVYAPGTFSTSVALGLPADISGGTEYIYAYQIFNTGAPLNAYITQLSVNLLVGGVSDFATLVSHLPGTPLGGSVPYDSSFNSSTAGIPKTNVLWQFTPSAAVLGVGLKSDLLVFASPNPPTFSHAAIAGQLAAGATNPMLPTPIPEPASIVLAATAAFGLLALGQFRRRRR